MFGTKTMKENYLKEETDVKQMTMQKVANMTQYRGKINM